MPAGGQTTKTRARSSGSVKPGSRSKGKIGKVRIKKGPRKGTVVNAYIYPGGKWWEIKPGGGRTGGMRSARAGRSRVKPKYSAASMRARAARKRMGLTFGKSHKANVRRNNVLKRFAPQAAVPHTRKRHNGARKAGQVVGRAAGRAALRRSPSKHRGGKQHRRRKVSSGTTTRRSAR